MKYYPLSDLMKSALGQCLATGNVVASSVVESLVYGVEQMTAKKKALYSAEFGDLESIASRTGKGWCVNGDMFLKSMEATNRNYCVIGSTGSLKSVTIGCSQLLTAWGQSFIVHDPSQGLHKVSHKYLKSKGYKIFVLNYNDPNTSDAVNVLDFIKTPSDAGKLANLLVRNSLKESPDMFWIVSATGVLRMLILLALKHEPKYRNLKNVQHLLFALIGDRDAFNRIAAKHMTDMEFAEYKALLKGSDKTLASVLQTCTSCLELLSDDSIARLSSLSTIDFELFRREPCALFLVNNTADSGFVKPMLSGVLQGVIRLLMERLPVTGSGNHVAFMLDEFSTLSMDGIENILVNNRKYNFSFAIFYQNVSQAYNHLGQEAATTLLSNCRSKLFLDAMDIKTSNELEELLGKHTVIDTKGNKRLEPLMPAQCIRRMARKEALFMHGEHPPFKVALKPYFEQPFLMLRAGDGGSRLPNNIPKAIPLIPLK